VRAVNNLRCIKNNTCEGVRCNEMFVFYMKLRRLHQSKSKHSSKHYTDSRRVEAGQGTSGSDLSTAESIGRCRERELGAVVVEKNREIPHEVKSEAHLILVVLREGSDTLVVDGLYAKNGDITSRRDKVTFWRHGEDVVIDSETDAVQIVLEATA